MSVILISLKISILYTNKYQCRKKQYYRVAMSVPLPSSVQMKEVKLLTYILCPWIIENVITIAAWYKFYMTHIY